MISVNHTDIQNALAVRVTHTNISIAYSRRFTYVWMRFCIVLRLLSSFVFLFLPYTFVACIDWCCVYMCVCARVCAVHLSNFPHLWILSLDTEEFGMTNPKKTWPQRWFRFNVIFVELAINVHLPGSKSVNSHKRTHTHISAKKKSVDRKKKHKITHDAIR